MRSPLFREVRNKHDPPIQFGAGRPSLVGGGASLPIGAAHAPIAPALALIGCAHPQVTHNSPAGKLESL
jgi:hypothetical protein